MHFCKHQLSVTADCLAPLIVRRHLVNTPLNSCSLAEVYVHCCLITSLVEELVQMMCDMILWIGDVHCCCVSSIVVCISDLLCLYISFFCYFGSFQCTCTKNNNKNNNVVRQEVMARNSQLWLIMCTVCQDLFLVNLHKKVEECFKLFYAYTHTQASILVYLPRY